MADRIDADPATPRLGRPARQRVPGSLNPLTVPPDEQPGLRSANPLNDGPALARLRVLVADDNPVNLLVVSQMLGLLGIVPWLAVDGAEAVALADALDFDLILMDLQMPVLDGLGATGQIRRAARTYGRPRVPVVAYTAVASNLTDLQGHGIDDLLDKPCSLASLRACLMRWGAPGAALAGH